MTAYTISPFKTEDDIQLIEDFYKYRDLYNKNQPKGEKLSLKGFVRTAIKNELEGKVLTNDFIELDEHLYFDFVELLKNKEVIASSEPSDNSLKSTFIVTRVPNTLDKWNTEEKTYCYNNNPSLHKGIYIYYTFEEGDLIEIENCIEKTLILTYDSSNNNLKISLVDYDELYLLPSIDSNILNRIEKEIDTFYNILERKPVPAINTIFSDYFSSILSYKNFYDFEQYMLSPEHSKFMKTIDEAVINEDGTVTIDKNYKDYLDKDHLDLMINLPKRLFYNDFIYEE